MFDPLGTTVSLSHSFTFLHARVQPPDKLEDFVAAIHAKFQTVVDTKHLIQASPSLVSLAVHAFHHVLLVRTCVYLYVPAKMYLSFESSILTRLLLQSKYFSGGSRLDWVHKTCVNKPFTRPGIRLASGHERCVERTLLHYVHHHVIVRV
jgi:hypothetical protein